MQPAKKRTFNVETQPDTNLLDEAAAVGGKASDDEGTESDYSQLLFFDFECRAGNTYRIYASFITRAVTKKYFVVQILEMTFVNGCSKSKTIVMAHNFQGYSPIPTQEWFGTRGDYAWGEDFNIECSGV